MSTLFFHHQCGAVKTHKVRGFYEVHRAQSPADGELRVKNFNTRGKNHTESLEQKHIQLLMVKSANISKSKPSFEL